MAKANQKAIAIKNFELATTGIIYHPPMDVIMQWEKDKRKQRRSDNQELNMWKFKKTLDLEVSIRNKIVEEEQRRPKHLPFSGGE